MRLLVAAALLCGATLAAGQTPDPNGPRGGGKSDWLRQYEQRESEEAEVKLPAFPKGDLVEFFVSSASSFRFFIDPTSLAPGPDGIVRYTLIARSRSGAENVSYEGMNCDSGTYKVYAVGSNGRWTPTQNDWRQIEPRSVQRWHNELYLRYFCVDGIIIRSGDEGVDALRRGSRRDFNNSERAY